MRAAFAAASVVLPLALPAPALALPDCPGQPPARTVAAGQGRLESIVGDARGRLFYTDLTNNRLLRIDARGRPPKVLATEIPRPGGLAFDSDGSLLVGYGGGATSGVPGSAAAGIFRINPDTGAKRQFVAGLDQANGLVRGPDGAFYTSNNIAGEVVRVRPGGQADRGFARVESANGLALDAAGRTLFAAQTFTPAKVARVDLAQPARVTTHYAAPPEDSAAGLDGLTSDGADRLFAAANGAGEVWRIAGGSACVLAGGLTLPSAAAFGGGGGFPRQNLYVVTFSGQVIELVGATDRPPAPGTGAPAGPRRRLRLSVRPRRVRVGQRVRMRFRVTSGKRALRGARIRFGKQTLTTGRGGTVRYRHRFRRAGRARARASRPGYRSMTVRIRVRPRR